MRILVACEFSGVVRQAFILRGHEAISCDLLPSELPGPHYQGDVRDILDDGWDMMIAHPPCTYTSYAGLRWFKTQPDRMNKAREAFDFFMLLWKSPIPRIAMENPRGYVWQWFRRPDQVVQPCDFGHPMTKATGLWLKGLPPLMASLVITDPFINWTKNGQMSHNGKTRSRTFQGIAQAMADQWG